MINLLNLYKKLVKKEVPVADISQYKDIKNAPIADISHHRTIEDKKKLDESIRDWTEDSKAKMVSDSLEPLSHEHYANLKPHHITAIDAYITGGLEDEDETGSRSTNQHLIEAHKYNEEPSKHFKFGSDSDGNPTKELHLDHLDDAIKQNKLSKSITTYSGISFDPRHLMDATHILHMPAYTSSSSDRSIANIYARPIDGQNKHIIKITHPKGSTGVYIGNNDKLSVFYQSEHLSPRNMKISINPEPEIIGPKFPNGKTLHIWHAKRITK